MKAAFLPRDAAKEVRALLPIWLACVAAVLAGGVVREPLVGTLALLAFAVGTVSLGAHSIGHEYTYRTLGLLLSQPSDRQRIFLTKIAVLAVLLCALTGLACIVLLSTGGLPSHALGPRVPVFLVGIAAAGLFVAPLLTMLSRRTLGGVVFALAIPVGLLMAGDAAGVATHGAGAGALVDEVKYAFFRRGMVIVCAVSTFGSWYVFNRLETIEGRGADIHLPRWLRRSDRLTDAAGPGGVHAFWRLLWKELHIQQITFVVCALYVVLWAAAWALARFSPAAPQLPLEAMTPLYLLFVPVLTGSLASAEERQFGTLEWQLLLPVAAWRLWPVKAACALGLAVLLGAGVPALLASFHAGSMDTPFATWRHGLRIVFLLSFVTACSLYVSSLSTSGVRALVLSCPAVLGMVLVTRPILTFWWTLPRHIDRYAGGPGLWNDRHGLRAYSVLVDWLLLALGAGVAVLLVRYAFINYRTAWRSARGVVRQVVWILAFLALGTLAGAAVLARCHRKNLREMLKPMNQSS